MGWEKMRMRMRKRIRTQTQLQCRNGKISEEDVEEEEEV
jgi:hypothetical protein